jgi:hypothetical protein
MGKGGPLRNGSLMPAPQLPKVVDATYIADTLTLEAEMFRGLLRAGCLTPTDAGKLAEELGRFCLEVAAIVKNETSESLPSESILIQSKCDAEFERLPAEALFWD